MRRAALALALLAFAGCAQTEQFTLARLAGPTNMAAIDAAAACDNDAALGLTRTEMASSDPPRRLMANFTQAAILTDMGRKAEADRLLATAAADPQLNPDASPVASFAAPVPALLEAIRSRRAEATGSRSC